MIALFKSKLTRSKQSYKTIFYYCGIVDLNQNVKKCIKEKECLNTAKSFCSNDVETDLIDTKFTV